MCVYCFMMLCCFLCVLCDVEFGLLFCVSGLMCVAVSCVVLSCVCCMFVNGCVSFAGVYSIVVAACVVCCSVVFVCFDCLYSIM